MTPRKIALIAGIIAILAVWGFLWYLLLQPPKYNYDWPGKARVEYRMKSVHGIWGCESDGKGWYRFKRDGKWCRL